MCLLLFESLVGERATYCVIATGATLVVVCADKSKGMGKFVGRMWESIGIRLEHLSRKRFSCSSCFPVLCKVKMDVIVQFCYKSERKFSKI